MDEEKQPVLCKECGEAITSTRTCKSRRAGLCGRCFRRAYDRAYRRDHKDRYRLYAQRYYVSHKEQLKDRNTRQKRGWRDTNRDRYRDYQRDYKRRARGASSGYNWEDLPASCVECGVDISDKWATKARRAGLCSACYERRTRSEHYYRTKARHQAASQAAQAAQETPIQSPAAAADVARVLSPR